MQFKQALGLLFAITCFIGSCSKANRNETKQSKPKIDDLSIFGALPLDVPVPLNNPITNEKTELGKLLFFDPILSGGKDVACATCHHPSSGFAENIDLSIGANAKGFSSHRAFLVPNDIPFVKRNSQTIINTAFNGISNEGIGDVAFAPMFWDLRAKSLEKQALEPIKAFEEMRGHSFNESEVINKILERLRNNSKYQILFKQAFSEKEPISEENLSKAIATYERTIIANNTRFDQYMRGDKMALSQKEIDGMMSFLKSGCSKCHNGPMFSDFKTHILGVAVNEKLRLVDDGFQKKHSFRTPSLRNLRFTFPYMHNGNLKTLQNVLEFYEDLSGGQVSNSKLKFDQIDPLIKHLKVDFKDMSAIVEFLNTLNDENYDKEIPKSVPSGLKVGGNI